MRRFALLLLSSSFLFGQFEYRNTELPTDTLAKVGSRVITAKDFLERFELMPWPNKDKKDRIEFTKLEFLYSLVAEKLLAQEAAAQNIGTDSVTMGIQHNFEKLFVRDEYYKKQITENVMADPAELRIGMTRFPFEIRVEVLGVLNRLEGESLYRKVSQAKDKRAVLRKFQDSLFVTIDTVNVSFGFPERNAEDAVFEIRNDSISHPVQTEGYGWVMFHLLTRGTNAQNVKFNVTDRLHKVTTIVKKRAEDSLALRTFVAVTSPQRAEANPDIFFPLADSIYAILRADTAAYLGKNIYQFTPGAMDQLQRKLIQLKFAKFITLASGDMTLGEVLQGLSNNNLVFPAPLDKDKLRAVLNNNIKTVIQNEMLTREGYARNLQQSDNVRHDVAVWMDNQKSRLLLRNVLDTLKIVPDTTKKLSTERLLQDKIDAYIGSLAKRSTVSIDEEKLKKVPVTNSSMVTWRYIGFGGRILAVPQAVRQFDWFYEWKKQERLNQ